MALITVVLLGGACSSGLDDNGGAGGAGGVIVATGSGGVSHPMAHGGSIGVAGASGPAGAGGNAVSDGGAGAGGASHDGSTCDDIQHAYAAALAVAQECTPSATDPCTVQVRSGFFCSCTTMVSGGADTLAAIVDQYQAAGCRPQCGGTCAQPQAFACQPDATSSTGARCLPAALLNLKLSDSGGSFSVPVGYEIDITLSIVGPGGFGNDVMLSSDAVTVFDIAIPAAPEFGGSTRIYRLRALSPGDVVVQIAYDDAVDSGLPAFTATLHIN